MTNWLDIEAFRLLCFETASKLKWVLDEPIPPFETRFPGRLESCLAAPQQTFEEQLLYPTLIDQAAILFYLINKDHPFINGNKRIALISLLVFLMMNGKWLESGINDLYQFSVHVASSDAREMDRILQFIKGFIRAHVVDVDLEKLLEDIQKRHPKN